MSGVTARLNASGNLVIESPHQVAGNARVIVERADMFDLLEALRAALHEADICERCGSGSRRCQCENDE